MELKYWICLLFLNWFWFIIIVLYISWYIMISIKRSYKSLMWWNQLLWPPLLFQSDFLVIFLRRSIRPYSLIFKSFCIYIILNSTAFTFLLLIIIFHKLWIFTALYNLTRTGINLIRWTQYSWWILSSDIRFFIFNVCISNCCNNYICQYKNILNYFVLM